MSSHIIGGSSSLSGPRVFTQGLFVALYTSAGPGTLAWSLLDMRARVYFRFR
jgi:hypothetical protein